VTNNDGTPYANESIYLRQYDPADPSPYIPPGARHDWDNGGGTGSFSDDGVINLPQYDQLFFTPWSIDQTDSEGRFSTILRKGGYFAGDNVAVEASAVPLALPQGPGTGECSGSDRCYRGGTFTWWKRMYLEVDNMFRSGAFLTRDVAPGRPRSRSRALIHGETPARRIPCPFGSFTAIMGARPVTAGPKITASSG
jgi:hypothetical protein